MKWIKVSDRLPQDRQRVLVWYPSEWEEAEFNQREDEPDDEDKKGDWRDKGEFYTISRHKFGGCEQIFGVEYWAEVEVPKVGDRHAES